MKLALRIYASEDEIKRQGEESLELKMLEKIIKGISPELASDEEEEKKEEPTAEQEQKMHSKAIFEKIVAKLLEYNDRINHGKEISVTEYFKRLD